VDIDAEDSLAGQAYASSFTADLPDAGVQSPEQWARATFEEAPRILHWFVLVGWRAVLRLRLEPRGSASVLGWIIHRTTPDAITLEARSSLISARKVLTVDRHAVILTTVVRYERRLGRVLWSAIAPVHHRIEPLLLTLAAARFRKSKETDPR
jgi:Protein of unknown function (DUF2867)